MGKPERTKQDRRDVSKRPVESKGQRDAAKRKLILNKLKDRARERCDKDE